MSREKRTVEEIKNDIRIVSSNKLNISQSKLIFMGFLYEIILSKEIFPKNSDLKEFVNNDLKKYLNIKDYIFKSRSLLAAKIQRKIYELDYNDIIILLDSINSILLNLGETKTNSTKNLSGTDKAIEEWRKYFTNKEK